MADEEEGVATDAAARPAAHVVGRATYFRADVKAYVVRWMAALEARPPLHLRPAGFSEANMFGGRAGGEVVSPYLG